MRQRIGALARPGAIAITVVGVVLAVGKVSVKLTTPGHAVTPQDAASALVMVPLMEAALTRAQELAPTDPVAAAVAPYLEEQPR